MAHANCGEYLSGSPLLALESDLDINIAWNFCLIWMSPHELLGTGRKISPAGGSVLTFLMWKMLKYLRKVKTIYIQ